VLAAGGAKEAFQLMMVEHLDTLAETSAKAISNIKFDKVVVWDGGGPNGATSGFLQSMANTLPPMMHVLREIAGVELPTYLGKMAGEQPRPAETDVTPTALVGDGSSRADGGVVAPADTPVSPRKEISRAERGR
jgi:flotillin